MAAFFDFFRNLFKRKTTWEEKLIEALEGDLDNDDLLGKLASKIALQVDDLEDVKTELRKRSRKKPKGTHKRWENQIENQVVEPLQYLKPKTLGDIRSILEKAVQSNLLVKAAGSGHSYSDVATTPDLFIDTHDLDKVASIRNPITGQLNQDDLKPEWQSNNMRGKWKSMENTPEIDFDSPLDDILKVRNIAQGNTLLFETEAGITIKNLNKCLSDNDLGLPNMGGYDGQTIVGAISTSTHGSGLELGPFPDMVKSLILATTGKWNGTVISGSGSDKINYYRIEPENGITNSDQYQLHQSDYQIDGEDIQLIQNDDCFYAVVVNMGTMGVIYSIVIEVIQGYYLTETRQKSTLDKTFELLKPNPNNPNSIPDILHRYRNFEVLVNPYPMDGNKVIDMDLEQPPEKYYGSFETLHTLRNVTHPPEADDDKDDGDKPRNPIAGIVGKLGISFKAIAALLNVIPSIAPKIIKSAINALPDQNYVKKSFRIYNLGIDGDAGFANEIGFAIQDQSGNYTMENFKKAVNSIHAVAQKARVNGNQYQTSPFSLRFVKKSPAYLSMMNGVNTCMIEIDMVTGSHAGEEILNRQQSALYELGGRPHWGLEFDQLNGNKGLIKDMYPNYPRWKKVYEQLNSKGTFDNKTTNRLGFSENDFVRN